MYCLTGKRLSWKRITVIFLFFQGKIFRIVQPECRCWRFLGPLRTCCRQKRQGQTLSPTSSICTGESPGRAVLRIRIHEIWSVESRPIHGIRIQIRIRSGPRSGSGPELGFFFDQALKKFTAGNLVYFLNLPEDGDI